MLVDGQPATGIPLDDRGLAYGDGLFESVYWDGRRAPLLDRHLERLAHGAARLGFVAPPAGIWREDLAALALPTTPAVIKLVLTRGSGPRGYRAPGAPVPRRIVSQHDLPALARRWQTEGTALRVCTTRLGSNPALAGLKHLNRLEQVLARSEWDDAAIGEGLMLDGRDEIIGGTMSNLCVMLDGVAQTPPVTTAGIAGVARAVLLERGLVVERRLPVQALPQVREAVLCNAVMGAVRVTRLADRALETGEWTRTVRAALGAAGLPC
jgi:4-amino-4-deoxychorismate lyase